jgi:GMP synthase-like glutamine amidotransferase
MLQGMLVGIVNLNRFGEPTHLIHSIEKLGHTTRVIGPSDNLTSVIKKSPIRHWFFTWSSYDVLSPISPQIDVGLFGLKEKHLFMICYSMESALYNLGYKLQKKPRTNRRIFDIVSSDGTRIHVWKSHDTYVPISMNQRLRPSSRYNDEIMTLKYKNTVMTQWHPERTTDGIVFMRDWLEN